MTEGKKNSWERMTNEFFGLDTPILYDPANFVKNKEKQ